MVESNTFTGTIDTIRTNYQELTSRDIFSAIVQWAAYNKSSFTKAIGVEAFGVEAVTDLQAFGVAQPTGRILRFDSGRYGIRGPIFATTPTSFHVGRLGNFTPELVEGGDEWAYSWHRLIAAEFIPDVDVQDNSQGLIDIKAQKMEGMKQSIVRDFNLVILGNASAPDTGVLGPSRVFSDLPHLISFGQTRVVGGIDKSSNTFWNNGTKAIANIGGGGEMDRPLTLRRSMLDALNDQQTFAEATNDYLMLGTQGAYQTWDRLMYADAIQGRLGGFGSTQKYDAAGIRNFAIDGNPFIWDPAVTTPDDSAGSTVTAGTETIYGIHIPTFHISIRSEENFLVTPWEMPREHDVQRTLVSQIRLRYTPMVSGMRAHFVAYNIPANTD